MKPDLKQYYTTQTHGEELEEMGGSLRPILYPEGVGKRLRIASRPAAAPHPRPSWAEEGPRRALNFAVAALGLLLTLPLMLLIGLAVRATSPGPVFYRQHRVGLDRRRGERRRFRRGAGADRRAANRGGRLFTIYKFRTMYADGGRSGQVWATPDDPRITPLGRVLRKYRLDELPQLINVLRGEMNIVGPRPEQPMIFAELRERVSSYPQRQSVLPGITGWAQVNHHYDRSIEDVRRKVDLDLEYIQRRSLWQDLRIMLRTLPVILFRRGSH